MALTSYQYSAQYTYLDEALRAQWQDFSMLESEIASFVPKPMNEFRSRRDAELERLCLLNPDKTLEEMSSFVDEQFKYMMSPEWQFRERFDRRHMTQYITVIVLSHALSEALINAVLAIGLANIGAQDIFPLLEKSEFRLKWLYAPKSFAPDYKFPVGTALNETLTMLYRQRNALVHLKIELSVEGKKLIEGTNFKRTRFDEERIWLRRYFSLPYDLVDFINRTIKEPRFELLFDRKPIEVACAHLPDII